MITLGAFRFPNLWFTPLLLLLSFFFFNDPATPEIYTLPLPDALPISRRSGPRRRTVFYGGKRRQPLW